MYSISHALEVERLLSMLQLCKCQGRGWVQLGGERPLSTLLLLPGTALGSLMPPALGTQRPGLEHRVLLGGFDTAGRQES